MTAMTTHLDERQRAMLQAMGIVLWQPAAAPELAAHAPSPAAPQGVEMHARQQLQTQQIRAQTAPDLIAPARSVTPTPGTAPSTVSLMPLPAGIAAMDWLQLQEAVSGCRACALCTSRKNTVFGVGAAPAQPPLAPQADWLIVGEAPGEHEDIQGEPFVGQAGKLLDNMLRAMRGHGLADAASGSADNAEGVVPPAQANAVTQSLSRHHNVFIANVLKCRPPANRNPSPEEMAMCQPYLHRQIALLRPKIILAMGRFAVQALLQSNDPIGKLRGRVHPVQIGEHHAPVVVTYHPAYLLRNLGDKAKAWQDLVLAMQTLQAAPR